MPRLNCNATACQYNCNEKCTRNTINVGDCYKSGERQVECKSFKEGRCLVNNEFAKDVCPSDLNHISITCDSKDCVYNHDRDCTVSCVDIKKPRTNCTCVNAECSTYRKQ